MEEVLIRTCTQHDIAAVVQLERQWEREESAYGNFNPMNWDEYRTILKHFPCVGYLRLPRTPVG